MAKVAITESYLEDIADAIRSKTGMSEETYYPSQMASAIMTISGSGGITPAGTININTNGTHNVTNYASANVSVPNSYSSSDEGKVVSNGALVAQSSATYTENGTYDTTLKNSVTVNVEGGGNANVTQDANGYIVVDDETVGGGGSSSGFELLNEIELSENTRSIQIDIDQSWLTYDILAFFANGEFTESDWLYWNINATTLDSGKYSNKRKIIRDPYFLIYPPMNGTPKERTSLIWQNSTPVIAVVQNIDMTTLNYFWLSGYSKDMIQGTTIKVYGGSYADLF